MRLLIVFVCAAFFFAASWAQVPAKFDQQVLQVGALKRSYSAYVPATTGPDKSLLILLHGRLASGNAIRANAGGGFEQLADREGFTIAYPDAMYGFWHDCRPADVAKTASHAERVDDVGFLRAMVQDAVAKYGVDRAKVFLFGFSNGGLMAMRMAWEASDDIAAIAVIAANMPKEHACARSAKTPPIMFVEGTADKIMPYDGGPIAFGTGMVHSARETAAAFGKANNLGEPGPESDTPALSSDPGAVRLLTWRRDGRPFVALYSVRGAGHEIPRPSQGVFDTPATVWNFFKSR